MTTEVNPSAVETLLVPRPESRNIDWPLYAMIALGLFFGAVVGYRFLEDSRALWSHPMHDRNAHYLSGQMLALSLRQLDIGEFVHQLDNMRVWGPLHGIVLGVLFFFVGPDYRLAVLPSWLGYILSGVLVFAIARRCLGRNGAWAGLFAALWFWTSPTYMAFATDVMLESSGACLTLWAVYLYLGLVQERPRSDIRWLALALTLLFFLKANYWMVALLGIGLAEAVRDRTGYLQLARQLSPQAGWQAWIVGNLRRPLLLISIGLFAAAVYVLATGGGKVTVAGVRVSLTNPHNFFQFAWITLFLDTAWRLVRGDARAWFESLPPPVRSLFLWHVLPISIYFLAPKRLGYFIWFLSPSNVETGMVYQPGWPFVVESMTHYYLPGLAALVLLTGLFTLGMFTLKSQQRGALVVFLLFVLGTLLLAKHPNRKFRFFHSFLPFLWIGAGLGFAFLLEAVRSMRVRFLHSIAAVTVIALLTGWLYPQWIAPHPTPTAGPDPAAMSALELTDRVLPHLVETERSLLMANIDYRFFLRWTFLERYKDLRRVAVAIPGMTDDLEANRFVFRRWLEKNRCDSIVFVDIPSESPLFQESRMAGTIHLPQLVSEEATFVQKAVEEMPGYFRATLWRRIPDTQARR